MGAYKVVFLQYADLDLERIVRYVTRENPDAAERLGLKLIDRALSLAQPGCAFMGSPVKKRPDVRRLVEGNYLIFTECCQRTKSAFSGFGMRPVIPGD
jgi:plasmid stabilization system protein ParE